MLVPVRGDGEAVGGGVGLVLLVVVGGRVVHGLPLLVHSVVDKDRNDQGTTAILLPGELLVSGQFRGRNMLNFCPSLSRKCALTFWLRGHV